MFKLFYHKKSKSFSSLTTTERSKSFIIYNKKKNFENFFKKKNKILGNILKCLNKNLYDCNKLNSNNINLLDSNKKYNKIFNENAIKILKENDYYDKKFSMNNSKNSINNDNNNNNNFSIKSYLDKNINNNNNNIKNMKLYYNYKGELLSNFSKLKYISPPKKIINKSKKDKKKTNFSCDNNSNVNFLNDLYNINKNNSNDLNNYKYNLLKNFNDFIENSQKFNNYYECNAKIKDDMIKQKVGINYPGNLILLKNNLEKYNKNFEVINSKGLKKKFKKLIHVPLNSYLPKPKGMNNNDFSYFSFNKVYNNDNLLL